jgi:1-acyl-sn-glycerol-3-phosphate acyltransferase
VSHLRALIRLPAFAVWCLLAYLLTTLSVGLTMIAPRLGVPIKTAVARIWGRGLAFIMGLRVTVEGEPPNRPFVLVSNHLGYVDIIALMGHSPGVFVAKSEIAHWPLLGPLSRCANTVFIDRESRRDVKRVNDRIHQVLDRREGLIMFPEGTSSKGADVLPFRSSLLAPAASSGFPVHYVSLSYRTPRGATPAEMSVCWWGDMTFASHFYKLLQMPGVYCSLAFGHRTLQDGDRRSLALSLQTAVSETFTPVVGAESSCSEGS